MDRRDTHSIDLGVYYPEGSAQSAIIKAQAIKHQTG